MFAHHEAKIMSTILRVNYKTVKMGLHCAFKKAIINSNKEIQFLRNLISELTKI